MESKQDTKSIIIDEIEYGIKSLLRDVFKDNLEKDGNLEATSLIKTESDLSEVTALNQTDSPDEPVWFVRESFSKEMIELTAEKRKEYSSKLCDHQNPDTFCSILGEIGFRYDHGKPAFLHGNVLYHVRTKDIKDVVKDIMKDTETHKKDVVMKAINSLNTKSSLELLPEQEVQELRDDRDSAYILYQNGYLKVSKGNISFLTYDELKDKVIRSNNILARKFWLRSKLAPEYLKTVPFFQFLQNVCTYEDSETGEKKLNQSMFSDLTCSIGKLMHWYNNPSDPRIVIFSEQVQPGDDSAGGTGKSLIAEAIQKMVSNSVVIDGKQFNTNYNHALQSVEKGTRFVKFDDPKSMRVLFEFMYSGLTSGLTINPKNNPSFYIPREDIPKFCITTNNVAMGTSDSELRRRIDIPLYRYYNLHHQPKDDFHQNFWEDYSAQQWNDFDQVMLYCLSEYFRMDYNINPMRQNDLARGIAETSLMNEIGEPLKKFMDEKYGDLITAKQTFEFASIALREEFEKSSGTSISAQRFNKGINSYGKLYGYKCDSYKKQVDGTTTDFWKLSPRH